MAPDLVRKLSEADVMADQIAVADFDVRTNKGARSATEHVVAVCR